MQFRHVQGVTGAGSHGFRLDMPEKESATGFALITNLTGSDIPEDMESKAFAIRLFAKEGDAGIPVIVNGRNGMNEWYEKYVGYRPDEDASEPLPIKELVSQTAEMMFYHLVSQGGSSAEQDRLNFANITVQMLFDSAAEDDLDIAIRPLQDAAGITTGDRAGLFFSGSEGDLWASGNKLARLESLVSYLAYEKAACDIQTIAKIDTVVDIPTVTVTEVGKVGAAPDLANRFVVYSPNESALNDEGMFWSDTLGWTDLGQASIYPSDQIDGMELPIATGNDATWMSLAEAYHGKLELLQQDGQQPVLTLELSEKENNALLFCVGSFVDNEHAKGNKSGVDTLLDEMVVLEKTLFDGARQVDLNLLQLALVQRALMVQGDGTVDETQGGSGWDIAISGLIQRIDTKLSDLRSDKYPNIYTATFQCRCPVNSKVIYYYLVVESKTMIPVEQITDLVGSQTECFHEKMAEMLFQAFPDTRQRLSAYHHGVHIKTIRKE